MLLVITAALAGVLFGLGLILSGMTQPAKVQSFLDLFGVWDPSLAFVMGGAIAVGALGYWLLRSRSKTLLGEPLNIPVGSGITRRLVLGSLAFGVGWGLAGFCPGPALVAVGAGQIKALGFVAAMILGMVVFEVLERKR